MLTQFSVRNAKPREKRYKLFGGGGLYLEIYPAGGRYWRLKYRCAGKDKRLSLGVYPEISLAEAREVRDKSRALLRDSKDPAVERQLNKARLTEASMNTFGALAQEWLVIGKKRWSPAYAERIQGAMNGLLPRLGGLPINQVTPSMVRDVVDVHESRGCLETARKTRRWISEVFVHGIQTGRLDTNPAAYVRVASAPTESYPHLPKKQLGEFQRRLTEYQGRPETRLALELLLLTFVRPGELRAARWEEFDDTQWRIPGSRMKRCIEHLVPLSNQALKKLTELRLYSGYSEYLFPNHGKHPFMSENTLCRALWALGYKGQLVAHGFRATASTILNESGLFGPDTVERQLAHQERNRIRSIYHRTEYLPERRNLMQWWADCLDNLRTGTVARFKAA